MIGGSLARRYARALLAIGQKTGPETVETLGHEVRLLSEIMVNSPELRETLTNPAFPRSERRKVIEAILERLQASKTTNNFTALLLDRDRLPLVPDIARELSAMINETMGRVSAKLTTAEALTDEQLERLTASLARLSGKQVSVETHQDPTLLGGVIAQVGDVVYDRSLRMQLQLLRTAHQ